MRPAKTQISLGIRPVWSESSQCTQWVAKDPRFLHADSEDYDQTGRISNGNPGNSAPAGDKKLWVYMVKYSSFWNRKKHVYSQS